MQLAPQRTIRPTSTCHPNLLLQVLRRPRESTLRPPVGVVNAAFWWSPVPDRRLQRRDGDASIHGAADRITDDLARPGIQDGPWVKHLFADGAYDRLKLMDKATYLDLVVEIIRRSNTQKGFEVLPRRWVVERSFGWMTRWRRLVRDYKARIDVSQAMILVAMGGNLLRRTTHP